PYPFILSFPAYSESTSCNAEKRLARALAFRIVPCNSAESSCDADKALSTPKLLVISQLVALIKKHYQLVL
ncbi:hypothetical protein, partial [Brevibacillus borstelensis]|uniref:hypothetical protein n=1 Tax=Brevibacillus borstelensis TaxID=45462 RepID=UPI001FA9D918